MTGHFCALAPAAGRTTHVPLCTKDGTLHPIRYEKTALQAPIDQMAALRRYLDIELAPVPGVAVAARVDQPAEIEPAEAAKMLELYVAQATARFSAMEGQAPARP